MMVFLIPYVFVHGLDVRLAYGEATIATLPSKTMHPFLLQPKRGVTLYLFNDVRHRLGPSELAEYVNMIGHAVNDQ
jgi:hypothetical protein